jgi:hypothetical protein
VERLRPTLIRADSARLVELNWAMMLGLQNVNFGVRSTFANDRYFTRTLLSISCARLASVPAK